MSAPLGRMGTGTLVVEEGGARRSFGSGPPTACIRIHSPRTWRMFLHGSRGMADAYAAGLWDSPDLVALVRLGALNAGQLDRARQLLRPFALPAQLLRVFTSPSTRGRRRRDIAAHYDLGNELFERMLDPTLSYSCAIFADEHMSLEQAQQAKLERICEKLELTPGDRILEIGSGWGGFAVHAAATRGCHVTTTTISQEQYEFVGQRVREAGLSGQVTVLGQDYRDLTGSYDKLVSIEMIEAVGWRHLGVFFGRCSRLLKAHGAMLLQAITIDDRAYEQEKASRSFIKTRIFPGGSLPSLEVIAREVARRTDMQTVDLEDLTPHYVKTLKRWRANFMAHTDELARLGYDERFRRLWNLYLAYCEAGFAERRICDLQLLLAKPRWRVSPRWARGGPAAASPARA